MEGERTAGCEAQWLALTYRIDEARLLIAKLEAERRALKTAVMRSCNVWGIRDGALTKLVSGK